MYYAVYETFKYCKIIRYIKRSLYTRLYYYIRANINININAHILLINPSKEEGKVG